MSDAILMINASYGKAAADNVEGLEAKVRASMRAVIRENWLTLDEDLLFRAGIGGAMLSVERGTDDYIMLEQSVAALRKFTAFLAASQAGISVDPADLPGGDDAILPLMQWWREARQEERRNHER